jgi:DNA-binding NarL/FixJ family response regulator
MEPIRYLIADDHKIFRRGLAHALASEAKLMLVGEAEDGLSVLSIVKTTEVDVVLLDLKMPKMDGIEVTKWLHANYPNIKVLMLTSYDEPYFILHLLKMGANGYLLKNADPMEISKAIIGVHRHGFFFNEVVTVTMLNKVTTQHKHVDPNSDALTPREKEVLRLICAEKTTTEIATELHLSPRTVEGVRTTLMEKLGVRNMVGLVIFAVKNGLANIRKL